jgi:outer membrane protein OmpA-like peptidoglycan-associated protein
MNWFAKSIRCCLILVATFSVGSGCSYVHVLKKETLPDGGEYHWAELQTPKGRAVESSPVFYIPSPPPPGTDRHSTLQRCAHDSLRHWIRSALTSMTGKMEDPGVPEISELLVECAKALPATTRNWTRIPNPQDSTGRSGCWTLPARDPDVEHDAGPWLLCEPRRHEVDNPLLQAAMDCAWWRHWEWFVDLSLAIAARERGEAVAFPLRPDTAVVVGQCVDELERIAEVGSKYPGVSVEELVELFRTTQERGANVTGGSTDLTVEPVIINHIEIYGSSGEGTTSTSESTRVLGPDGLLDVDCEISFGSDSAKLTDGSKPCLDAVAQAILEHPAFSTIEVEGHTNQRGTARHNQLLSEARAEAVAAHLIAAGVEPKRLTTVGRGSTDPRCEPLELPKCLADNRRVELHVRRR